MIDSYKPGERSRETEGKSPVFFAVDQIENVMGFMAARLLEWVNSEQVLFFVYRTSPYSEFRTDAMKVLWVLVESHRHLQEYIDEFVFRFNRRFWDFQVPYRLL